MRESIWKGSLGFGLVSIPVTLRPAEERRDLQFALLDRRDMSPVGYRKVNKNTGAEVPARDVVKGYEYAEGRYVIVEDEDFQRAAAERSQRIEISAFIDAARIDPAFCVRPYYLEPAAKSEKPYALLREALKRTGKAGVATLVIARREHLAAVLVRGSALLLELLRFAHELRDPAELHLPSGQGKAFSAGELKMAERLVDDLSGPWKPEQYQDRYHDELRQLIERKAKGGRLEPVAAAVAARPELPADIMALLKQSVVRAERGGRKHGRGR